MIERLVGAGERTLIFNLASSPLVHFMAKRFYARNLTTQMNRSQTVRLPIKKIFASLSCERFKRMTYFDRMLKSLLAYNLWTIFIVFCGLTSYIIL